MYSKIGLMLGLAIFFQVNSAHAVCGSKPGDAPAVTTCTDAKTGELVDVRTHRACTNYPGTTYNFTLPHGKMCSFRFNSARVGNVYRQGEFDLELTKCYTSGDSANMETNQKNIAAKNFGVVEFAGKIRKTNKYDAHIYSFLLPNSIHAELDLGTEVNLIDCNSTSTNGEPIEAMP